MRARSLAHQRTLELDGLPTPFEHEVRFGCPERLDLFVLNHPGVFNPSGADHRAGR